MLRLATHGFATIYLTLPAGEFLSEWKRAEELTAIEDNTTLERLYVLGQPSMAVRLTLYDFRHLIKRVYPGAGSHAIVANSVFSTAYVIDGERAVPQGDVFRFLTHMRARRRVYWDDPVGAEEEIVEKLRALTHAETEANVTIEAGVGWADFAISGTLPVEKFDVLLKWLVEFNRVKVGRTYAFKRTLTLIGYPWASEEQPAPRITFARRSKVILLIRVQRGGLHNAKKILEDKFKDHDIEVSFVDGKLDIVAICSDPKPDFLECHRDVVLNARLYWIERIETHLMFDDQYEGGVSDRQADEDCECTNFPALIEDLLDSKRVEILPTGTATAVKNIAFLSSSTCEEKGSCCDARPGIVACWKSFNDLLDKVERLRAAIARSPNPKDRLDMEKEISRVIRDIDLWVVTADRVLRQRTVGSFEEFLGQSDRSLSYGGGVQKGLLISDLLMNDFYSKVTGVPVRSRFATVYDSVDRITSVLRTGIVRIPVTRAFYLPGALPDLWHEVGCYDFFRALPKTKFTTDITASEYRDVADHYGDFVSLVFGFEQALTPFATALVQGFKESVRNDESVESKEWKFTQLLSRLVAACELLAEIQNFRQLKQDRNAFLQSSFQTVELFANNYLGEHVLKPDAQRGAHALKPLIATRDHLSILHERIRKLLAAPRVQTTAGTTSNVLKLDEPAPLTRFTPDTDLNAEFRNLLLAIESTRDLKLRAQNAHAPMAALARSAAIEYYRRLRSER